MSLSIKNLTKHFGSKCIFDGLSLEFDGRGAYAILGESGIGKTTLLRIICGIEKNFSGEVIGGGVKNTSVVFQEYRLFPRLSAVDNVIFANHDKKTSENQKEAENMLFALGFSADDVTLYPSELSGGMKQRVSIARALLRKAPILLLDEPTKELDPENAARLLSLIKKEAETRTVIIITHKTEDAELLGAKVITL